METAPRSEPLDEARPLRLLVKQLTLGWMGSLSSGSFSGNSNFTVPQSARTATTPKFLSLRTTVIGSYQIRQCPFRVMPFAPH
jgi:hypothetical protein